MVKHGNFLFLLAIFIVHPVTCDVFQRYRRGVDYSVLTAICRQRPESDICRGRGVRREPEGLVSSIIGNTPISLGRRTGQDARLPVPLLGTLGLGDISNHIARFIPEGAKRPTSDVDFSIDPNLGYMESDATGGQMKSSANRVSLGGIGDFVVGDATERGTGILELISGNIAKAFPFLEVPTLEKFAQKKIEARPNAEEQAFSDRFIPRPSPPLQSVRAAKTDQRDLEEAVSTSVRGKKIEESFKAPPSVETQQPPEPFQEAPSTKRPRKKKTKEDSAAENPFDRIKTRPEYNHFKPKPDRPASTSEDSDLLHQPAEALTDEKSSIQLLSSETQPTPNPKEGFIPQKGHEKTVVMPKVPDLRVRLPLLKKIILQDENGRISIAKLGLSATEIYNLCVKFAPVAAKHCYTEKIDRKFIDRCKGYKEDCAIFQAPDLPLGRIANAFSNSVGMTYGGWGVNGIPFYPVNEEGGVSGGHHGKVDFGTWGGGYSDQIGVRDFYSQTGEAGANWYEGLYGYKNGWAIPIAQVFGAEGGGGTQVSIPIKEGHFGRPMQVSTGYHVGPYLGLANQMGIDWLNGGISMRKGMSVPLAGVSASAGSSFGFPSIGQALKRWGIDPRSVGLASAPPET